MIIIEFLAQGVGRILAVIGGLALAFNTFNYTFGLRGWRGANMTHYLRSLALCGGIFIFGLAMAIL